MVPARRACKKDRDALSDTELTSVVDVAMKLPSLPSNAVANAAAAMVLSASLALSPLTASPALAAARTVGEVQTSGLIFKDTLRVEAFDDPKVDGVLLYLSDFQRPVTEKISKGDIFSDPSQGGLACSRKGDVVVKQGAAAALNVLYKI